MSGGFLNSVFKVWHKSDPDGDDVFVIRVFTDNTSYLMVTTQTQVVCMRAAHAGGCGQEVMASFTNGIIYRFSHGELLNPAVIDDMTIRRLVF